ncbi:precorrin-6A reductase [Sedimentibacter sp. zth1]|uniref:precorrin-6A reductase n=1 Tax=Sedimentibacter sp. zth1 TaxID=2816908 RepID=UPI001A9382F7|nr:precorrin-6A reductase [Sedimentibacter sp. zth1]QSX05354.1 precorrin-6A reductase [Sedimentibacter sp. zth1]
MLNICVFAGTTEGRKLVEYLNTKNLSFIVCVATEYGEELMLQTKNIHVGRLDYEQMIDFFVFNKFSLVIDATHPYASVVTNNIINAAKTTNLQYIRLNRESDINKVDSKYIKCFDALEEIVEYLKLVEGNILLTTGSKELDKFTEIPNYKERIYPRVLPLDASLELCRKNGYDSSHIIAMQGPFTKDLNKALIKSFDIKILVTKESGNKGGFLEKINACDDLEIECLIVKRPKQQEGYNYEEVISIINSKQLNCEQISKKREEPVDRLVNINIVGIGVGCKELMTNEAYNAIKNADIVIGAKRILESCVELNKNIYCAFLPKDIQEFLQVNTKYKNIVIVMSGDVGFYSGAKKLLKTLENYSVKLICGISSPIYMCSKLKISWQDIKLCSLHGRYNNIVQAVKTNYRVFTLVGGDIDVKKLCEELIKYNLSDVKLYVGERLSYIDEKISVGTPSELLNQNFEVLSSVIIENRNYSTKLNIGISDEKFIREKKVPMTKSEVRAVSIAKLNLSSDSVVYDIGAGSGSVSIEAALISTEGMVYAIEKKHEAVELIEKNKIKFGTPNIKVVEGFAPEALEGLPTPTHAFIGGSSGNLVEIIKILLEKNKNIRIVINSITLETISETLKCIEKFDFETKEIINLSIAKSKNVGNYNMMMGQNPIYIVTIQN